jgi:hypothetical protein
VKNSTYQGHVASRHDASAKAPVHWHSAARAVPHSTRTRTVDHDSFESSLAEQRKKKYLDWESGSLKAFVMRRIL